MLGRIELEQLQKPAIAATHFARVTGGPLFEDAAVRHVEALAAAGQTTDAEALARIALERLEDGPRADKLKQWLDDPQHDSSWLR